MKTEEYGAAERFVSWLERQILNAGCGGHLQELNGDPTGRFWLGRLAPQHVVMQNELGDRGERLEPCAIGIKVRPIAPPPWTFRVHVRMCGWRKQGPEDWRKTSLAASTIEVTTSGAPAERIFGRAEIADSLVSVGLDTVSAEIQVERTTGRDGGSELTILLVNTTDGEPRDVAYGRLFECTITVDGLHTTPFLLEALPDSFRWDRRVPAWGINCGIRRHDDGRLETIDMPSADRFRPAFWSVDDAPPDIRFTTLQQDPLGPAHQLLTALENWGSQVWSDQHLGEREIQEAWSPAMRAEAAEAAEAFRAEMARIRHGIELLEENPDLNRAFRAMNRAMTLSAHGKYDRWRPFQFGFLLANLSTIVDGATEANIVDIVWFATGGGKTETYLGLLITAALIDRMRGKTSGVTAWSRFPLRLLSLQQTQRFANALAAAELVRRDLQLHGDAFSLGFLVGSGATPNRLDPNADRNSDWDPDDESMPARLLIIDECPFCRNRSVHTEFDRALWRLNHVCSTPDCPWGDGPLPIHVVDDEIWRFLPTVIVGTLDKAASISMQASMRGMVGAPLGFCSRPGHGYTYAKRSARPNGCLVPGCRGTASALPMAPELFGPSFRLQDELHLLRDSLGAVDAHYEALFDDLQFSLCGTRPKILASSATLTGYQKQVHVLYRREARVFPQPEPAPREGFWTRESDEQMRRFVAIAPRGVTIEFATDRLLVTLQAAVRRLLADPQGVCREIGVDPRHADFLANLYGTNVVYGNTLRDLDAVMRSTETQLGDVGAVPNVAPLTGRTDFADIRRTLSRLEAPEADFNDRLHILPASSMMSHGVDIDRLNVMVMLGHPLGTAEFIQATARVGRKWPALVIVVHKIGRERDASLYRAFPQFVLQGDRFVEPIPITSRSRRVLERTIAGMEFARIIILHEPRATDSLTTAGKLAAWVRQHAEALSADREALAAALGLGDGEQHLLDDLETWFEQFQRNLEDPPADVRWTSDLSPTGPPMRSLRDVEEQALVRGEDPR